MSRGFVFFSILLAALLTAGTYLYTVETKETLSDPGLADLVRIATVHGWPWGYYAEVTELTVVSENRVAVLEYWDIRWQMLAQTYLVWFVVSLIFGSLLVLAASPGSGRSRASS
jgi:hypothetical protein